MHAHLLSQTYTLRVFARACEIAAGLYTRSVLSDLVFTGA